MKIDLYTKIILTVIAIGVSVPIFNSKKELCFCLSTHTAKSRKDINDLKKVLSIMLSSANNLKKVLFKD